VNIGRRRLGRKPYSSTFVTIKSSLLLAQRAILARFVDVPFHALHDCGGSAMVGDVPTKAIIDTGGQTTIANLALQRAIFRRKAQPEARRIKSSDD
jgi:hypothetical protein